MNKNKRIQENSIKSVQVVTPKGKHSRTHFVNGIDEDIKPNKALWVLTENICPILSFT
ncbi:MULTISPECIES: hypothetical protein [Providencia]|uniref:Uncharacterized protein n=1 Tax=Providencia stuartii TaxID=588 RepID=A0AAI9D7J8_PROST|nr:MULTISPECIES: hypothetical protein [Providencia]ELR5112278.1 hypothetical protein [Providencia stuartii]MDV5228167.1 hypothetical protein [Providencia rettgeri]